MIRFTRLFLVILTLLPFLASAQEYSTKSKKAIRFFETAMGYYDRRADDEAIQYANEAIKTDKKFIEAWLLLAELYNQKKDFVKEIECYNKVNEINPAYNAKVYYLAAKSEFKIGMYEQARQHLDEVSTFEKVDNKTAFYVNYLE